MNISKDSLLFAVSANSFDLEKDSILSLSLKVKGATSTDYSVRLYARDSKGALFETWTKSLSVAPYYGKPAEYEKNGVWFWSEEDNVYNLRWRGLPEGKNIALHYAKGDIDESICGANCSKIDTLLASNAAIFASAQSMGFGSPYEVRKPKNLDRAMLFGGDSGSVQFSSQKPLWLQFKDIATDSVMLKDTTFIFHLGRGGSAQELVASYLGGFQANPGFYGLYYEWNGVSPAGNYPQGDTVLFYAVAVENIAGGRVLRDSVKVGIKKPALTVKAPLLSLDDFNVVNNNGDASILGNKTADYGILWRDANVSAYVRKKGGDLVKTLFENKPHAAVNSEKAYMLSWNGIDEKGHLVIAEGDYYFEIAATESDASGTPQTNSLELDFKISFASGVKYVEDDPDRSPLLSLAYADSVGKDHWRYTPIADYLVHASAIGKTLPDSLRTLDVEWDAQGTQSVQGYPPQRFSLAVKRQRQTLPLVILYRFKGYERNTSISSDCKWSSPRDYIKYGKSEESFTSGDRSKDIIIKHTRNSDYGFDETQNFYLDVWAVLLKDYNYTKEEYAVNAIDEGNLNVVWSATVPIANRDNKNVPFPHKPLADSSCSYSANNIDSVPCGFKTKNYNPNANLFVLTASPNGSDGYFLTDRGNVYETIWGMGCENYAPREINIKLNLTIPDKEYWNVSYGYDNLVNRTIRLDQTNITMYGGNEYLKQVANSQQSVKDSIFYDGEKWHSNYTYGMLTPPEQHRFPFVSVDNIPTNNAFAFPDEDKTHKYSSYYHAKFFNQKGSNIVFKAQIKGYKLLPLNSPYDSTSLTSNEDSLIGTKLFWHGKVDIYVSMNASDDAFKDYKESISYPASKNWMDTSAITQHKCPDYTNNSWLTLSSGGAECRKFYENYSGVSYGDSIPCDTSFSLDPSKYDSNNKEFYHKTNCIQRGNPNLKIEYSPKIKKISDSLYRFSDDTLYVKAEDWNGKSILRNQDLEHGWKGYPKINNSLSLQSSKFFKNDLWVKEFKLDSAKALLLDSNNHTHFNAKIINDSIIELSTKNADSLSPRPAELIAIKGLIPENSNWKLSYVNLGNLHTLASNKSTGTLHEWFNVNKLQGNTSILLQWGGDGTLLNIRKLDLDIGAQVRNGGSTVVSSLFGEVSVNFPDSSIGDTIVTVRTADAKEYGYRTSTGSALLGPVIEVLPSMKFMDESKLPRIKARVSKVELNGISPDRVRLYKIDSENKKFIELQNTLIGFADGIEPACDPANKSYDECDGYSDNWTYLIITAETQSFSAFAILSIDAAEELNTEPVIDMPSQILCAIPPDSLWLGLDNGWLEMPQSCNQPAMGILQLRQGINIIAEARQNAADTLRWNGKTGIGKIAHGSYASRYIAIGSTGQEMQTLGPAIHTDTLRPAISNWSVEESTSVMDREYKIHAKALDDFSGISLIRLDWSLSEAISGKVYLSADKDGNVDYTLHISRKQLAQCLGCKLNISLYAADKGNNHSTEEWQSGSLWPYPAELALWYPSLEGAGKTAREYTGTGHDLDLLMPTPWLSASGIYFNEGTDKALGRGTAQLGSTDAYTLEAWVRPGYVAASGWRRVLGFNLASGKNVELQVNGSDVRLLDGFESWSVPGLLPLPKTWTHLVVAVDADYARFYADGKLAGIVAAVPSERLWSGVFSLGTESGTPSFAGHLMQVRFYKRALEADEALALFSGIDIGEGSHIEIALAGELNGDAAGMERGFSCAVPGSSYWGTSMESSFAWNVWVEQAASYKIFLYARSSQPGNKTVKAGVSGAFVSGTVSLESVWRPVALQEMALPLKAGFNNIELRLPPGVDIAGIAVSDNSGLQPSQISWKSESSVAGSSTVDAQIRFEGSSDLSMLRPRIRLQNIGSSTIYGPKVRYYFRGEDPAQVHASKFYPQEGTLVVRQESSNLGYAEWSFPETTVLPSGQLLFWGEGPHFGLNNTNYVPWMAEDDPGIVVLDADNKVLSGSCFENEEGLISVPVVQVLARDSRAGDSQASQLYIKLENIGQVPIRDYEVRYSFYVPGSATPVLDVYDMQGLSASLKNIGSGRWQVSIKGSASLGPGISWANPAQFALHLPNWQTGWNASDDPSYKGISAEWALAKGIEVFDASGNRIYGNEPAWTSPSSSSSTLASSSSQISSAKVRVMAKENKAHEYNASAVRFYVENLGSESISGFEYDSQGNLIWGTEPIIPSETNNPAIDIVRLPDGLLITLLENSLLRLDLVNAAGMPQKFIYQGTLGAGQHIVPVDWSNIDFARTYLVTRLNGKIAMQFISTLRN
ncbi:hypothetical protein R83H12_01558 [Fibrobacteria bacterium R8-3-H12]